MRKKSHIQKKITVIIQQETFKVSTPTCALNQSDTNYILIEMVMGFLSRPINETEKDVQQGEKPIMLSLCLMTDILVVCLSFSLLLLLGINMPELDQTEDFPIPSAEKTLSLLNDVMVLSLFATFFAMATSMFAVIYSITILFGNKYNWPCCPGLKNMIRNELLGPLNDEKDDHSSVV